MSGGRMADKDGRRIEVIVLDRCDGRGPQPWYKVTTSTRILLGPGEGIGRGYYRTVSAALAHVDVETLVEVVTLPTSP